MVLRSLAALSLLASAACRSAPAPEAVFVDGAGMATASQPEPGDPARPNVVLVVIESLHAGTVLGLRDDPSLAPNLARLLREGTSFERAYTTGSWTMPGLASLLTGRYPRLDTHGSSAGMLSTAAGARTLPEILGHYGYATAGVWGSTLACGVGTDLPFQRVSPLHCGPSELPADAAVATWVEHDAREPFLLMVHNIDLHAPEPSAPEDWLHRHTDAHPACPGVTKEPLYPQLEAALGPVAAAEHVVGHYRGQLAWYDRALGRMLEALDDEGLLDDTVVVVTTNHGQDLFEHSCFDHGTLYDPVLHIPLIWWERDGAPRRVDTVVQNIDLLPSLLARAGVPFAGLDGQSLLPLMGTGSGDYQERPVFSLSKGQNASLRTRERKLILSQGLRVGRCDAVRSPAPPSGRVPHYELYDLVADPGEAHDLYPDRGDEAAPMAAELGAWLSARRPKPGELLPGIGARERRALQERGYWDLAAPQDAERAPPPKPERPVEDLR